MYYIGIDIGGTNLKAGLVDEHYRITATKKMPLHFASMEQMGETLAGMAAALVAIAGVRLGVGQQLDKIIIGAFMGLVPGVAITNFMRDILAGDLFSGITKLAESLLTATAIALGAGIALSLARAVGGVV